LHPWVTKNNEEPLYNDYHGKLSVNEEEIKMALTKLTLGMGIKTICKMRASLNRSRIRIKDRKYKSYIVTDLNE
jgi:hypothetical protein